MRPARARGGRRRTEPSPATAGYDEGARERALRVSTSSTRHALGRLGLLAPIFSLVKNGDEALRVGAGEALQNGLAVHLGMLQKTPLFAVLPIENELAVLVPHVVDVADRIFDLLGERRLDTLLHHSLDARAEARGLD